MSREKDLFQVGDTVKRNDNGRTGTVVELQPIGFRLIYAIEDEAGNIVKVDGRQLRPVHGDQP